MAAEPANHKYILWAAKVIDTERLEDKRDQALVCLTEVCLESCTVAHPTAATAGSTFVCAEVGTSLGSTIAVDEFGASKALLDVAGALEHAGVHVRCALWSDDGHALAVHVDFTGDVNDAVWRVECTLAPGIENLTIQELAAAKDWSPGSGPSNREGDSLAAVVGD